jgi:hypothetical protein
LLISSVLRLRAAAPRLAKSAVLSTLGAFLLLLPLGMVGGAVPTGASSGPHGGTPGPTTVSFSGAVTYNGQATANASNPSSALSVSFGSTANLDFSWHASGGKINQPLVIPVQTARLQVMFLGLSVYTKDQTLSPPSSTPNGTVNLSADFTLNRYLLEGLYELSGSLITPNGTVAWSENFYVKASAPYHLTAASIGLALIALYEVYTIAIVGRWVTQRSKGTAVKNASESDGKVDDPPAAGRGGDK